MINGLPQIHLIYNRYKKASTTQKAVVEIRISYDRKQKYISTGIWLYPNQWKNGKIVNCDNIVYISRALDALLTKIRNILLDMVQENHVDIFSIPDRLKMLESRELSFIEFCRQRASIRKYGKEKDTQERYDRFLKYFSKWGKIVSFKDITDTSIIAYDRYLTRQGMKPYSKWNNYHRFLNSFILDAIDLSYK